MIIILQKKIQMIQINKSVLRDRGTNSIKCNKYEHNFKGLVYHKIEIDNLISSQIFLAYFTIKEKK